MQQDYTFYLEPGGREFITIGQVDFIFVKAADRPVIVTLDGYSQVMEVNQKTRPEQRFDSFELENPDPNLPLTITIVAGLGDYTTQSIKGQLNIVPSIIKADGSVLSDRRRWLNLFLEPSQLFQGLAVQRGENFSRITVANQVNQTANASLSNGNGEGAAYIGEGVWAVFDGRTSTNNWWISKINGQTGDVLDTFAWGGGGTNNMLQDLVVIDENTFVFATENGALFRGNWGDSDLYLIGNATAPAALDPGERALAIGLSPDRGTLWAMRRTGNYTGAIESASFNADTVTIGAFTELRTLDVPNPSTSRYFQVHGIFHQNGQMLFAWGPFGGNIPKPGIVEDLNGNAIDDFSATWEAFNNGVNDHTYRVWLAENEDGNLTYWEDTQSRRAVSLRWPVTTDFTSYARADDEQSASLVALFQAQDYVYSDAGITSQYLGSGRFKITGEVINFALQTYLQKIGLEGYLDAVFGIQIPKTGTVPAFEEYLSGNETFKRAGVPDQFSVIIPGVVRLYVDQTINEV